MKNVIEYTIVATSCSEDLMAAAAACNKSLKDIGESTSLEAAEEQISSCRESLRHGLRIEAEAFEVWKAWEDGCQADAEIFCVPVGGTHDVAEMGAAALGVDVSEKLNVSRC